LASYRPFRKDQETSKTAADVGDLADTLLDISRTFHDIVYWAREQRIASPDKRAPLFPQGNYPFPLNQDLPDKPPAP
jgi:hypothetical protein